MLGYKELDFKFHPLLMIEEPVPENLFVRGIEAGFDLEFVCSLVSDYCSNFGHPQ